MHKQSLIRRLKEIEPDIRATGVCALFLYGSYARDEAKPDSDIDVFVEFDGQPDLLAYLAPYALLEDAFPGVSIGYGTRENLSMPYRSSIEHSAIRVF